MKRLIVFGAEGMLGRYVMKFFHQFLDKYEIVPINREQHDIVLDGTQRLWMLFESSYNLNANENDIIINCAGMIPHRHPDKKELIEINTMFPHDLAMMAKEIGFKVIHITTDCVFSGEHGSYNEYSVHDARDDYGKSKSLGESDSNCNIRTSIIGEEVKNKLGLLEWAKSQKGKTITGFKEVWWNGVTCLQLCKFIQEIVDTDQLWKGVRHYHSPAPISKYALLWHINDIWKLNLKIKEQRDIHLDKTIYTWYRDIKYASVPYVVDQLKELKEFNIYE